MLSTHHKLILSTLLGLTVSACGGSGGSGSNASPNPSPGPGPSSAIDSSYQGIWLAPAYGRAVDIGGDRLRILDFTSEFCLSTIDEDNLDTADIKSLFRFRSGDLELYADSGTLEFAAPGVRYQKTDELPQSCRDGMTPSVGDSGYQRDPQRDLRLFHQLLKEYSIYPELRDVDIDALLEEQLALLSTSSSDEELLEAAFSIAEPLADIHTEVTSDIGIVKVLNKPALQWVLADEWLEIQGATPPLSNAQINALNTYIGDQIELDRAITLSYADDDAVIESGANELLTWFVSDGVGYLAIDAMFGFSDPEDLAADLAALDDTLDRAFTTLQDAEVLVLDVRRNGGGRDVMSLAIAGRFAANEALAYRKQARLGMGRSELVDVFLSPRGDAQFLGPVVLLTSATTASAAEVFTLAMRSLPQVTLVGEATQGGLSDALQKTLTNGFGASIANEYYLSVDDELFEAVGIPVDLEVPQFRREARLAEVDETLEAVLAMLAE